MLRLSLHPQGLASKIVNIVQWRAHLFERLRQQVHATGAGVLGFISTTTVFGSAVDVTLQELALETFFPADDATAQALRRLGDGQLASAGA